MKKLQGQNKNIFLEMVIVNDWNIKTFFLLHGKSVQKLP